MNIDPIINRSSYYYIQQSIKSETRIANSELIEQNDSTKIQKIYDSSINQLSICKQTIREVKKLQLHTINKSEEKKLANSLESLKESKSEIIELKKKAGERLSLVQKRQALYGQNDVPVTPDFAKTLDDISLNPELKEGCEHFKHVTESLMGLKSARLVPDDIQKLHRFADMLMEFPEYNELYNAVINQCENIERAADRKETLLHDLGMWMENEGIQQTPFNAWSSEQKLYFLSKADQVMNNPFEAKFEIDSFLQKLQNEYISSSTTHQLCDLLKNLWEEETKTSTKTDFWNYAPPFERRCHNIADTPELKEYLYTCKIEGLKDIIFLRPKDHDNEHLIVGAGPSGLISALSKEMLGLNYKIVERRGEEKIPRENTITLGKGDPKDMEILYFLGVVAEFTRDDKASFGHNKAPLLEVKIGDVEEGLLHVLEQLHGSNPIDYSTEISTIEVNEEGQASVTLTNSLNGETAIHLPASVTVTDGFSGRTKNLLGISRIDLAKPTMIAFSLFKNIPADVELPTSKTLKYRISNALKGMVFMSAVGIYKVVKNKPLEESFAKVIKGGPSAIFRVPDQDYLIRVLRKKEQSILADYRTKIKRLDQSIAALKTKPETARNTYKATRLQEERKEIDDLVKNRLKEHAEEVHGMLDFFQTAYNPVGHRMKKAPMTSTTDFLVDIQVGKAERNVVVVGNIPFLIRGDASHSTDPYSGYGCKTALEEIQADQNFFNTELSGNTLGISMLAYGHEYYQQRMINVGLQERHSYRKRTETLARYTDRAVTNGTIDHAEAGRFSRLIAKKSLAEENPTLTLTESDKEFASDLQNKLRGELQNSLEARDFNPTRFQRFKNKFELEMTGSEKRLLRKALRQAFEDPLSLNPAELKELEALCAKMTFKNVQEGWMLAMIYQNANLLTP